MKNYFLPQGIKNRQVVAWAYVIGLLLLLISIWPMFIGHSWTIPRSLGVEAPTMDYLGLALSIFSGGVLLIAFSGARYQSQQLKKPAKA